jgi:hypothetical protein
VLRDTGTAVFWDTTSCRKAAPLTHALRQVWEVSRGLLRRHALPPMRQFTHETATTMHALDMDIVLAALPIAAGAAEAGGSAAPARKVMPSLPRSKLRTASPNLKVSSPPAAHWTRLKRVGARRGFRVREELTPPFRHARPKSLRCN